MDILDSRKRAVSNILAVLVIVGIAAAGITTVLVYEDLQLQSTISSDSAQISSLQSNVSNLQTENTNLNNQLSSDGTQISSLQSQNSDLQNEISNIQRSPDTIYGCGNSGGCTLTIWTASASLSSSGYFFEAVPDTFDYYDVWTSTSSIIVYYLSNSQYVQFANCGGSISCVSGAYYYDGPTTSANYKFTLAEGCGGYVAIYQLYSGGSGTIYPDISITYNPAPSPTGVCA